MKITVSKHTTIDWEAVKNELCAHSSEAVGWLVAEAQRVAPAIGEGETRTIKQKIGKITIRRSKD